MGEQTQNKELTPKEVGIIEAMRNDSKANRTQANMKRLNRMMNRVSGKTLEYCLCSDVERAGFHSVFYAWYDNEYTAQ